MAQPQALRSIRNNQASPATDIANNFPAMLEKFKGEIARALPKHLNPDRMVRIALTAFRMTPKLAECDPRSVFAAVIQASQLGLEVGLNGEAHLVPFGSQCQLIPGYTGLMKLARNGGNVIDIYAHDVRAKDTFSLKFGLERDLKHEPLSLDGGFPASDEDRGQVVGFYAVAVFKDGNRTFVAMGRAEVESIRDNSRGYQAAKKYKKESPWDTNPTAMGMKTAIRRLCKYLPKSPELAAALALDATSEQGKNQNIDLSQAIAGEYTPVADVDEDTGEISTGTQPQAQQQDQQQQQQSAAAQKPAGKTSLEKAIQALESATSVEGLDEVYIRLESDLSDNDLEQLAREYRRVKQMIEGNSEGSSLF